MYVCLQIVIIACGGHRFRPGLVKDLLHEILVEYFHDKEYSADSVEAWTKELCDNMRHRLKGTYAHTYVASVCWFKFGVPIDLYVHA